MRRSLLVQLSSWYALSAFALILLSTGFLYWSMQSALAFRDAKLIEEKARTIRTLMSTSAAPRVIEWGERKFERIYVRILDEKGNLISETPGMGPRHKQIFTLLQNHPRQGKFKIDDLVFRAGILPLNDREDPHGTMMIALDRTDEERIIESFQQQLLVVVILSLGACLAVGYRIARQGLSPLEKFTQMAQDTRPSSLHKRIDAKNLPAEFSTLADRFNDMLARLEGHMSRISEFSSDIAHELRTPINNLVGTLSVALRKTRSTEEYSEILSSSIEECHRIGRIIESLLFIARAEQPNLVLKKEPVEVAQELEEIASFYEASATDKGITIQKSELEPVKISAERTLLQRAVGNLIANAIQYTPAGGKITVSTKRDGEQVKIQVLDTGIGIAPENLPKIFERFYRVDYSRSKNSGGMGLGLPIVKSIVSLHGGQIEIESQPNYGTNVVVRLPTL